jgi:hypothetical protein
VALEEHDLNHEKAVIDAANRGEDVYGREALLLIAERIESDYLNLPLFAYLATNLKAYLVQGVPPQMPPQGYGCRLTPQNLNVL